MRTALATALLLSASQLPAAAMTVRELNALDQGMTEIFLAGLGEGIFWANAAGSTLHQAAELYCPPKNLGLTGTQYVDIFRSHVRDNPQLRSEEVGLVMMMALRATFPC